MCDEALRVDESLLLRDECAMDLEHVEEILLQGLGREVAEKALEKIRAMVRKGLFCLRRVFYLG